MRIFSRLVFLCNLCFIITVALRFMERKKTPNPVSDGLSAIQPLENSLIILGYGAIILNFIFALAFLIGLLLRKRTVVPLWLIIFNFLLLAAQVLYFFVIP